MSARPRGFDYIDRLRARERQRLLDAADALDARRTNEYVAGKGPMFGEKETTMTSNKSTMRRFVLERREDVSGTSGTGTVAEGVEYSNGRIGLHWLNQYEVVSVYDNITTVERVHGHGGLTTVRWIDEETR